MARFPGRDYCNWWAYEDDDQCRANKLPLARYLNILYRDDMVRVADEEIPFYIFIRKHARMALWTGTRLLHLQIRGSNIKVFTTLRMQIRRVSSVQWARCVCTST